MAGNGSSDEEWVYVDEDGSGKAAPPADQPQAARASCDAGADTSHVASESAEDTADGECATTGIATAGSKEEDAADGECSTGAATTGSEEEDAGDDGGETVERESGEKHDGGCAQRRCTDDDSESEEEETSSFGTVEIDDYLEYTAAVAEEENTTTTHKADAAAADGDSGASAAALASDLEAFRISAFGPTPTPPADAAATAHDGDEHRDYDDSAVASLDDGGEQEALYHQYDRYNYGHHYPSSYYGYGESAYYSDYGYGESAYYGDYGHRYFAGYQLLPPPVYQPVYYAPPGAGMLPQFHPTYGGMYPYPYTQRPSPPFALYDYGPYDDEPPEQQRHGPYADEPPEQQR